MTPRQARAITTVILAVSVTAAGASASIAASQVRCRAALEYTNSFNGTGDVFAYFRVRDVGTGRCRLGRYPRLIFRTAARRRLRIRAAYGGLADTPGRKVTAVAPGRSATFLVIFRPGRPDGQTCGPAATTVLLTTAGGTTAAARLPRRLNKLREPINPCGGRIEEGSFISSR